MKTIYNKLLLLLLLLPFSVLAQSTLTGRVVEESSGQPLPGVNVVIEGTANGTSTDFDGNFTLTNVSSGSPIVFSYVGYKDVVINYKEQQSISISMSEDANQLAEVVVQVGYGSVRRQDATGAVEVLSSDEFNRGNNITVENLLNGR